MFVQGGLSTDSNTEKSSTSMDLSIWVGVTPRYPK